MTVFGQSFRRRHVIGDVHRVPEGFEATAEWMPGFAGLGTHMTDATRDFAERLPDVWAYRHNQECRSRCTCETLLERAQLIPGVSA